MSEGNGGDKVIANHRDLLTSMMPVLDHAFNGTARGKDRRVGFTLLTYPMNAEPDPGTPEGRCNFASNGAQRADLAAMFRFLLARWAETPERTELSDD
jgi:hypothetical protein